MRSELWCQPPTSWLSGVDPVRVGDAGDGEDVCGEEKTSWYHGEFIHHGGHGWRSESLCASISPVVKGRRDIQKSGTRTRIPRPAAPLGVAVAVMSTVLDTVRPRIVCDPRLWHMRRDPSIYFRLLDVLQPRREWMSGLMDQLSPAPPHPADTCRKHAEIHADCTCVL